MLPSYHDDILIGYDVECEARRITLRIRPYSEPGTKRPVVSVLFTGVLGYQFEDDALGNIINSIEVYPPAVFLEHFKAALEHQARYGGLPLDLVDPAKALNTLSTSGVQCFVLDASIGLHGWIMARNAAVLSE
jgi:hypothetical protein